MAQLSQSTLERVLDAACSGGLGHLRYDDGRLAVDDAQPRSSGLLEVAVQRMQRGEQPGLASPTG